MGYRPTGRSAGRPSGPVTVDGKLTRGRKTLPHVRAFAEMARAVDRVLREPDATVHRDWTADARDVDITHNYTPKERGQVLSFVWWVYVNRSKWNRNKLTAAIESVSPLMMFSSSFLAEITGLPQSTVSKRMLKPVGISVTKIAGNCDPWVVHKILTASTEGEDTFRQTVRELALYKGVPKAFLTRMTGVPTSGLDHTERGIQFFPERPDWASGRICSVDERNRYWKFHPGEKKKYDPRPGDQRSVRDSIAGAELGEIRATSTPVPDGNDLPYYLCIPGLPTLRQGQKPDGKYFQRVEDWEADYHLRVAPHLGS